MAASLMRSGACFRVLGKARVTPFASIPVCSNTRAFKRFFAISLKKVDKTLDVILLEEQKGFGFKGELVNLKRGHARQLISHQQAVYASEFNRNRFMVEISKEELKAREERAFLDSLKRRFSKLIVKIDRGADPLDEKRHKRGVSLSDIQRHIESKFNMDIPIDYLFLPGKEPTEEVIIEGENLPNLEKKDTKKDDISEESSEDMEIEVPDDPMIAGGKIHGFGSFEIKVKVAGYLVPLQVVIHRWEPPEDDEFLEAAAAGDAASA
eukprot:jgi/Bigna1/88771/estExt_fgenesh1_pg.C_380011